MSSSRAVPAWPVIGLTYEGDTAVADAAGVGEPIRVAAYPDLATAAASAAASAARRLNMPRCRVQGISPDGEEWMMVVDAEAETLEELHSGGVNERSSGRGPWSPAWLSVIPRRWWLVIGVTAVAGVAMGVMMIPRSALPTPAPVDIAAVDMAPAPPAGQLPVSAPAGWDTYAGWVIDVAKPGAAAVLGPRDTLVLADGPDVITVDARTGRQLWRTTTAGNVTALYAPADSDVIYAARSNTGVSVLDASTGSVVTSGDTTASEIVLAETPFAQLPGQAGAVLVDRAWQRRQVPATAVPIGTVGAGLVSVSVEQAKLWVTTSDSPVLPAPASLTPPAEGLSLSRVVAFVDGQMILAWADRSGPKKYTIDSVEEAGRIQRRATLDAADRSSGKTTFDAASGLVGIGSLLLDLNTQKITDVGSGTVTARAGFGWTEGSSQGLARISPDGTRVPLRKGAAIPDVVLPDGRAVVRAAHGSNGSAYYALEVQQPTPAATPSPTRTGGKGQ